MTKISKMEWDIIDARVTKAHSLHSFSTKSTAFLSIVLEQLFPGIQDETAQAITDGSNDRGVDAIHIIEGDGQAEIYIFQSKYRESHSSCTKTINDGEILKISLFLNELFEKAEPLVNCENFRLSELVHRIWDIHQRGSICRYHIIFCSNGSGFSASAKKIIDTVCTDNPHVGFEFYSGEEIIRSMAIEGRTREDGSLQVVGKEILERSDGDVRGVIASVDAKSFIDLIETEDGEGIKRHLFDDNLRVFLGAKGGFNPSIISTATSQDSYLFWYLNNGITITCRNFSYNKGHTNPTLQFEDFQIVNGAQTSHSLIEANRKRNGSDALDNVVLMVRVYATDRPDIAERVAVATNSQARIQSRDLRSNNPTLKKLELALHERGYFFERKRNMHADKPDEKRVDALKLGQTLLAFELREPDKAKSESDSIFDSKFHQIFHDSLKVDHLVRLFELYRAIERLRDAYVSEYGSSPETDHEHRFLVYGHWFVLFTCKLLHVKSQEMQLPVGEDAIELIEEAIRRVANACGQSKAVAHYQMFRSPRTKEKILGEVSAKQTDFFELLAAS